MKYWAFLSYSHTDKKWGDWLHKALETYRVPRRLVGKESRDGKVPERVYPIFRDREELPVSADLGSNINEALRESRYLIVICSPRSAQSRWVGEEIKTFKKLGREDRILALIVDGEPNASDGKPGFKVEDECFHEAMRYRIVDGQPSEIRTEPIAADAREGKDGKSNAKLKLLAGLLGVNYDDLKQREQERRLRRARIVVAASVALIAVFAALSVALFFKEREATRARDEATRSRDGARATLSNSDFFQALRSIAEDKDLDALAQLARSVRNNPDNQGAACRLTTLLTYRSYPTMALQIKQDKPVLAAASSSDGRQIVSASGNLVRIWNSLTGEPVGEPFKHDGQVHKVRFSSDGGKILTVASDNIVRVWDALRGTLLTDAIKCAISFQGAEFSPDGKFIITMNENAARVWSAENGSAIVKPIVLQPSPTLMQATSPDGKLGADKLPNNTVEIYDVEFSNPKRVAGPIEVDGVPQSLKFTPDSTRLLITTEKEARLWDARTGKPVSLPMKDKAELAVAQLSPDAKRVVTVCEKTARIWDGESGVAITAITLPDNVELVEFSPDSKRLAVASYHMMAIFDAENGKRLIEPISTESTMDAIQFSPDGTRIMTRADALDGKNVQIWDARTGKSHATLSGLSGLVDSAEFSADGKRVVTLSGDYEREVARVWDADTGKPISPPIKQPHMNSVSLTSDGKFLVTNADTATRVWDVQTGRPAQQPLAHDDIVNSAQFSPDGKRIVTASYDHSARVWDASTGRPLGEPMKHDDVVSSAQFSPDGKRIVTASYDHSARVWDASTGRPLGEPMKHDDVVLSAQFSPDGQRIVSASMDNTARVWNATTGKPLGAPMSHNYYVSSACFSPEGKRILTSCSDGTARVWNAETGKLLSEPIRGALAQFCGDGNRVLAVSSAVNVWNIMPGGFRSESIRHQNAIASARFNANGDRILTASWDASARIWDAETLKPIGDVIKHDKSVNSAQFSSDGKRIVTASQDYSARIWDAETGRPLSEPMKHMAFVHTAEFSPDGKRIVTASSDSTARIWDGLNGKPLTDPMKHDGNVSSAKFSPNGRRIVTISAPLGASYSVRVWDSWTWKPLTAPFNNVPFVFSADFSPDGARVIVSSIAGIRIWDPTAAEDPLISFDSSQGRWAQFSPDGKKFVTATGRAIRVWDTHSGNPLSEPMPHEQDVDFAQFSPDGKWIITKDTKGRVWDAESGRQVIDPLRHKKQITSISFSSDGERVITGSIDGTARVWDLMPKYKRVPGWLLTLADVCAGQHLNDRGFFDPLPKDINQALKEIRQQLDQQPTDDHWAKWGRWFLADRSTRTISPFSKITISEYIENRIKENTAESLGEAEELAVGNAELLQQIQKAKEALALAEKH